MTDVPRSAAPGRWITPYTIEKSPAATIVLKDEKTTIQGKVFLELNRFIIFVAPGGEITAVAITDINSIPKTGPAKPKDHQGNH